MLSFVSGVFAVITYFRPGFFLIGILAIVTGHFARLRIRRGNANPKGNSLALAGLCMGYTSILLGILETYDSKHRFDKARKVSSFAVATALESSINSFLVEYEKLPHIGDRITTESEEGRRLLTILLGMAEMSDPPQNSRDIRFLAVREGKNRKNGLIYSASGSSIEGLYDSWGNPYTIELDTDIDEFLRFKLGTRNIELNGRRVAVHSAGADRKDGTADDVITW